MTFPTTSVLDDFNRTGEGPPPSARWTTPADQSRGMKVNGNQLVPQDAVLQSVYAVYNISAIGPDCEVYVTLADGNNDETVINLLIRLADYDATDNATTVCYKLYCLMGIGGNAYYELGKFSGGSSTSLADDATTPLQVGDAIGLSAVGDLITVWRKPSGGAWGELFHVTDTAIAGAGYIGIIGYDSLDGAYALDDFGGGTIASEPEPVTPVAVEWPRSEAEYEIWLARDDGTRIAALDHILSMDYVRAVSGEERWSLILPGDTDPALIARDRRVEIWRAPVDGTLRLEISGLLTAWQWLQDDRGRQTLKIGGPSLRGLLRRRIVAYAAGSAQSQKTAEVDDLMKAIVRENFGEDATDTARALDAALFGVVADLSQGASMTKGFSWRNVLDILNDLSEATRENGPEVYFDVAPTADAAFEFRTMIDQPGLDRRAGSSQPLIFSVERGNLSAPALTYDYDREINFVYSGGQGEGEARVVQTAEDTSRSGASLFARSEGFADARNDSEDDGVQAAANAALSAARPAITFSGALVDTPMCRYGRDWAVGYRVTAEAFGASFDGLIRSVRVTLDGNRKETIQARIEVSG